MIEYFRSRVMGVLKETPSLADPENVLQWQMSRSTRHHQMSLSCLLRNLFLGSRDKDPPSGSRRRPPTPPPGPPPKKKAMRVQQSPFESWFNYPNLSPKSVGAKAAAKSNAAAASAPSESGTNEPSHDPSAPTEPSHEASSNLEPPSTESDPKKRGFWYSLPTAKGQHKGGIPCPVMLLGSNINSCVANVSS